MYVDLEESFGSLPTTRAVYERILDLRIATPQIVINYAKMLEEHKYFEDSFRGMRLDLVTCTCTIEPLASVTC